MAESTSDILRPYMDRILATEDRVLFEEARLCASASAFRAAYVFVWITCAESLKRRFKEMSTRDGNALKVTSEIGRREALHQAIDAYILEQAKNYGILSDTAYAQLEYIYSMRCIYGHPYEKQPSQEELLAAAQIVVDALLAQPTRLRHGFLTAQLDAMATEPRFLDDLESTVRTYAAEVFEKTAVDCQAWFIERLWKALESLWPDASRGLYVRRLIWFLRAFGERVPESTIAGWSPDTLLKYPMSAAGMLAHGPLFVRLSPIARDTLVGTLIDLSEGSQGFLRALVALMEGGHLTSRQAKRCLDGIQQLPLTFKAAANIQPSYYLGDILRELKSHNWYRQNAAVAVVQNMGPEGLMGIRAEELRLLGNNVLQAADGSARDAIALLGEMAAGEASWPSPFTEGVISECFVNEHGMVRYKPAQLEVAVRCLMKCDATVRTAIVVDLVARIEAGVSGGWRERSSLKEETLTILRRIATGEPSIGGEMSSLVDAVSKRPTPSEHE